MTRPLVIPTALAAPAPGWTVSADVVVIGSGVAGLVNASHGAPTVGGGDIPK